MNILISSTLHWNPGDEWIMAGCQNIFREALPKGTQLNWITYNRNPDLMHIGRGYSQPKPSIGNYLTASIPDKIIDVFVQAGSPEWHGPPASAFHEAILRSDKPYIMMGLGATNGSPPMTELDVNVMMRPNTYIYTRATETANAINRQLGVEKAQALPCPAICVSLGHGVQSRGLVQIPQNSEGPQSVKESYLIGLDTSMPVIAETAAEWEALTNSGFDVQYIGSASGTLNLMSRYSKIITTRLHAAVAALSLGSSVALVGKGDYRIETAAKMFGIPVFESFEQARNTWVFAKDSVNKIKYDTLNEYKTIIQGALK